jgi:L-threonylcarbamoyladenylate synthase
MLDVSYSGSKVGAMKTEVLAADTPALFAAAVKRAADLLRAGDVVALPTETVYGLAANALDARAVARIYETKGRPPHNPIIVHVSSLEMARRCVAAWPASADRLAAAFWPGPLTLVLPRAPEIPEIVTAGGPTVGVRWPAHPFIEAVICECGFPLAAPSANLSAAVSPTSAEHVRTQLGGRIKLIVDGGPSRVGIESTVLDLTSQPPKVLRPGMIHEETLRAAVGNVQRSTFNVQRSTPIDREQALRSPGLLQKHYAPKAKLVVLSWRDDADLRGQISSLKSRISNCHVIAHNRIPSAAGLGGVSVMPHDAEAFGRALYAELHRCDDAGAGLIVVETPPATTEWGAIADRLRRAAAT